MIYLILAVISSALVSVVMRMSQRFARNNITMLAANYVMCTAAAAILAGGIIPTGEGAALTMGLGSFCGVLYLLGFVLLQWNIQRNGVVLPATFQKLGVLVPTIAAITVFGETARWTQLLGIAVAIGAILLMQGSGARTGEGNTKNFAGLIALLMCGGLSDVMSKVFQTWGNADHGNYFLVFTFLIALVLCLALCVVKKQSVTVPDVLCGLALGVPNYMSARFLLWALREVPAVVVYPSFSVGTIIVVTLVGMFCFREQVEKRKLAALGLILGALVLLNV
ncbi:MAG: EamA family transporter [Clostridia bacterium]|nr:EamA family transporter [Clostridia bacterium]